MYGAGRKRLRTRYDRAMTRPRTVDLLKLVIAAVLTVAVAAAIVYVLLMVFG